MSTQNKHKTFALVIAGLLALGSFVINGQTPSQRPAGSTAPDDTDVIRVDTNLVNTVFTAVDKDRHFLTSLKAEDVRIFENNVAQAISLFERETNRPLTLAIMIDTSESQRGVLADEKKAARTFVESVIRSLPANGASGDRAAIISFTGEPKIEQQLTGDQNRLKEGIERIRIELSPENVRRLAAGEDPLPKEQDPSGYTGIWDAMWMAVDDILSTGPANTRRAIVLLSDGDDTSSTIKRQDVIDLAVKSDVVIYSIGIRDRDFDLGKLDSGALKKVSDRTGGRAFFPLSTAELTSAFTQIDQELRSQYLIGYSPTNLNRDGAYRQIRIEIINPELRKNKVQLLYRGGYYARNVGR
ncbi:MAG TPA: VWA domain-containing protein [Pyrinomonadaceae bacterium]|nr:VWA domain-containing protein [Pyrinomonadaceae bacterium]